MMMTQMRVQAQSVASTASEQVHAVSMMLMQTWCRVRGRRLLPHSSMTAVLSYTQRVGTRR